MSAQAKIAIRAVLDGGITEAQTVQLARYVLALHGDATPMRKHNGTVGLAGSEIYSTDSHAVAKGMAESLNAKFTERGATCTAAVKLASAWRTERVQTLRNLIASLGLGEVS